MHMDMNSVKTMMTYTYVQFHGFFMKKICGRSKFKTVLCELGEKNDFDTFLLTLDSTNFVLLWNFLYAVEIGIFKEKCVCHCASRYYSYERTDIQCNVNKTKILRETKSRHFRVSVVISEIYSHAFMAKNS